MFEDKTLVCRDCGKEFVFSASEQQFFADKGFQNDPTRCHECRAARRNRENPGRAERQYYEVICDGCGCTTQVPFQPKGDRPVYCRECFERNRNNQYCESKKRLRFGGGAFFVQSRKKPARRQKSRRAGCGMSRYSHNR